MLKWHLFWRAASLSKRRFSLARHRNQRQIGTHDKIWRATIIAIGERQPGSHVPRRLFIEFRYSYFFYTGGFLH
jgi:hypothetical protein